MLNARKKLGSQGLEVRNTRKIILQEDLICFKRNKNWGLQSMDNVDIHPNSYWFKKRIAEVREP